MRIKKIFLMKTNGRLRICDRQDLELVLVLSSQRNLSKLLLFSLEHIVTIAKLNKNRPSLRIKSKVLKKYKSQVRRFDLIQFDPIQFNVSKKLNMWRAFSPRSKSLPEVSIRSRSELRQGNSTFVNYFLYEKVDKDDD